MQHTAKLKIAPTQNVETHNRIATFMGFDENGRPQVAPSQSSDRPVPARTCVPLHQIEPGTEVVVVDTDETPVIIGCLLTEAEARGQKPSLNERELSFRATDKIQLRCGKASIVLRADGKIMVRGVSILSRASFLNRIRGSFTKIN